MKNNLKNMVKFTGLTILFSIIFLITNINVVHAANHDFIGSPLHRMLETFSPEELEELNNHIGTENQNIQPKTLLDNPLVPRLALFVVINLAIIGIAWYGPQIFSKTVEILTDSAQNLNNIAYQAAVANVERLINQNPENYARIERIAQEIVNSRRN